MFYTWSVVQKPGVGDPVGVSEGGFIQRKTFSWDAVGRHNAMLGKDETDRLNKRWGFAEEA